MTPSLVTINVTNVNEAPSISGDESYVIDENTTALGTYTVADEDTADSHTWSVDTDTASGNEDRALFQINQSGVLSFRTAPDYDMPTSGGGGNVYYVRIKVTDNGSSAMSATLEMTVEVEDVNERPVLVSPPTTKSVPENSTAVHEYAATDVDANTTLSWSLSGADAG